MGSAVVYINRKHPRGWEISADPDDIFDELYGDHLRASSEKEAIYIANEVVQTMMKNSPFGHPDDSEILLSRLSPPGSYEQPWLFSMAMQNAASGAGYSAMTEHGLGFNRPFGMPRPEVATEVLYKTALKHLRKMSLDKETKEGAAWLIHSKLSEWEKLPLP